MCMYVCTVSHPYTLLIVGRLFGTRVGTTSSDYAYSTEDILLFLIKVYYSTINRLHHGRQLSQ